MSTVLVTGGSRGIGREICISFAKAGYDIAFCYQKDEKGAKETLELIRKAGGEASVFVAMFRMSNRWKGCFLPCSGWKYW